MNRTDVAIADIARALCEVSVKDPKQKLAIFEKSLQALVRFAISQREVEQFLGAQNDLAKVAQIMAKSKE